MSVPQITVDLTPPSIGQSIEEFNAQAYIWTANLNDGFKPQANAVATFVNQKAADANAAATAAQTARTQAQTASGTATSAATTASTAATNAGNSATLASNKAGEASASASAALASKNAAEAAALQAAGGGEPTVLPGTTAQYWRGDKTWRDLFADVRAATLTGLSTATNRAIAASDTVLVALGLLQAALNAKLAIGQFGFGGGVPAAVLDCNNPTIGWVTGYFQANTNTPSANRWLIQQIVHTPAWLVQFAYPVTDSSDKTYVRYRFSDVWTTWRMLHTQGNILGTVSQSSGVPTGAIIERGSNANGEYVKFADGTLLMKRTAAVNTTISSPQTFNFPAAFVGERPAVSLSAGGTAPGREFMRDYSLVSTSASWQLDIYTTRTIESIDTMFFACGRWY